MPVPTPLSWKARNLRHLIKSILWAFAMVFVSWLLGIQTTWQLIALILAAMMIDNTLDAWLPSSSDNEEQAKALVAAEEAGYQRGLAEAKLQSYTAGRPS